MSNTTCETGLALEAAAATGNSVSSEGNRKYPDDLRECEAKALAVRRQAAMMDDGAADLSDTVGVALSGGGIRSATFCLGIFQALARQGLIGRIDYLSTVSGGGYFGGFLGRLFTRPWISESCQKPKQDESQASRCSWPEEFLGADKNVLRLNPGVPRVENVLKTPDSAPMRWLRDHGRYLSPNGAGDFLLLLATHLRNWATVTLVWVIAVLALFLLGNSVRAALWMLPKWLEAWEWPFLRWTDRGLWWSPWVCLPLWVFLYVVLPCGLAFWITPPDKKDVPKWYHRLLLLFSAMGTVLFAFLVAYRCGQLDFRPNLVTFLLGLPATPHHVQIALQIGIIALLSAIMWGLAWRRALKEYGNQANPAVPIGAIRVRKTRNHLNHWFTRAGCVALTLLGLAFVDTLGQTLYAVTQYRGWTLMSFKTLATVSGVAGFVALAQKFKFLLDFVPAKSRSLQLSVGVLAPLLAFSILVPTLVALSAVGHGFLWHWGTPTPIVQGTHVNPGKRIVAQFALRSAVSLSEERHIRVDDLPLKIKSKLRSPAVDFLFVCWASAVAVLLCFVFGQTLVFLNLSSHHAIYASRLAEAYLGASNPNRWRDQRGGWIVDCDDVPLRDYRPHEHGGPLHLINMTLNETVSGRTRLEYRDRKGLGMVVGPCGVTVGTHDNAVWMEAKTSEEPRCLQPVGYTKGAFHIFVESKRSAKNQGEAPNNVTPESLSLRQWLAVSGAAFTTGMGSQTSLGKSLLFGLTNLRLGYWWNSGVSPRRRVERTKTGLCGLIADGLFFLFPVQMSLFDELLGRFGGPGRKRWYLSDGGHFENTGCYELIRRRVPFIIVCDNGQDSDSSFENLAGLVRKARIDFNADIRFFTTEEIDQYVRRDLQQSIGTLDELKAVPKGDRSDGVPVRATRHATLAWVDYADGPNGGKAGSVILFIKPTLTGDEPCDVLQYQFDNPDFPQQSTIDQYFDEAQWESYRRLGQHIGDMLFCDSPDSSLMGEVSGVAEPVKAGARTKWTPRCMSRIEA